MQKLVWPYWLVMALLLLAYLAGFWANATCAVAGMSAAQAIHFLAMEKRLMAFPVQLRIACLL